MSRAISDIAEGVLRWPQLPSPYFHSSLWLRWPLGQAGPCLGARAERCVSPRPVTTTPTGGLDLYEGIRVLGKGVQGPGLIPSSSPVPPASEAHQTGTIREEAASPGPTSALISDPASRIVGITHHFQLPSLEHFVIRAQTEPRDSEQLPPLT